ncbi:MAG: cellulase family glycosylhydrolase [Candidatus Alcyoniella australis]|nr:cellulase family glycosylhydrolase [Candidatus Alcyoniella australis]
MSKALRLLTVLLCLLIPLALVACDQGADDDDDDQTADDDDLDDDDLDDDADDDDDTQDPDWDFIVDEQGRALILHGCNFDGGAKWNAGLPPQGVEQTQSLFGDWGFNFARYLIFRAEIDPEPGVYNEDYLGQVETRLDWLEQAGIRVVLDMHQDVWGPEFHSGGSDGAPPWATITDGVPHIPFAQLLGAWALDYLSPAVMRAFDNFWDYELHPELQDLYAAMWVHVVQRFKDHPSVLGYDLINEPWEGTGIYNQGRFDRTKYFEFNQRMIDAIRSADQEGWIFYEPRAFGPNQGLPSHLPALDDPRPGAQRLAYFPHMYSILVELEGGYDPLRDPILEDWPRNRTIESELQRAPLLAGEWSLLTWPDLENRLLFNDAALRMFESATSGWAYWDCGSFERSPLELQELIASPFPRAVAGWPLEYGYDQSARELSLTFEARDNVEGPTEIYLPLSRCCPDGYAIEVSGVAEDGWHSEFNDDSQLLSIWIDETFTEATISIFAAQPQ